MEKLNIMKVIYGTFALKSDDPSATEDGDTSTFIPQQFEDGFEFNKPPVVVLMTQTFNGADTPGLRIGRVTRRGFNVRFNEVVVSPGDGGENRRLSTGTHFEETVGYIAIGEAAS
jgi:hypothetical protein